MKKLFIIALMSLAGISAFAQTEQELFNQADAFLKANQQSKSDSIMEIVKKKFPKGMYMRNQELNAIYKITNSAECEKAYKKWYKTYSPERLGNDIVYDYAAFSVALLYAKEGNEAKTFEYLHRLTSKQWVGTPYLGVGSALLAAGKTDIAEKVYAEGVEKAEPLREGLHPMLRSEVDEVYTNYANILLNKGDKVKALYIYNKVSPNKRGLKYAQLILEEGKAMQAFTMADAQLRKGNMGNDVIALAKAAWQKANGNLDGCEEYIQGIKNSRIAEKRAETAKSIISEPAPDFTIKDIDGNDVSLSDYRGKVVVLDFWATWCQPCKRSFPAMKMAVEKYKDDKDVQFLFIHTWERVTPEEAYKEAKAYITDNGYSEFRLLMDTKDPSTRSNKAVSAYKVSGIPAKFVIDKKGNIRFKVSGFSGSDEEAVAELQEMISQAKKMSK